MLVREADLSDARVVTLLSDHLADMRSITPPESVHALDPKAFPSADLTLWSAWEGEELLGCGALKELSPELGEIKAFRTVEAQRGKGVASRLLEHLLRVAADRGFSRLSLETGSGPEFAPARRLYARYGFEPCPPFGDYEEDPNSAFMSKALGAS